MEQIPQVFISYPRDRSHGQALACDIYKRLQHEGIEAFFDEENILPGDRWLEKLADGSKQCLVMLTVVSPAAHDRPWVEKEFIAANQNGVQIIPVLATEGDLPFQLGDLQAAQLYGEVKEQNWIRVLKQVRKYIPIPLAGERQLEITYLNKLLDDNEERALKFASNVYTPLAGNYRKEFKRIAAACMSPRLRHLSRTQYDEPPDPSKESTEYEDIIAAFKQNKRLIILGEPGAGKTFSLWKIAAEYAQLALKGDKPLLPVVIPLNRWDVPDLSLHDFFLEQLGDLSENFIELYEKKRLIPFFDALNEIPFDQREKKLPQVKKWLVDYPTDFVLLTCRQRDYRGPLEQKLDRLNIEPLDPPRIYEFLHNYYCEDEAAHELAEQLFWQLAGGYKLRNEWEDWKKRGYSEHWEDFWSLAHTPMPGYKDDNQYWLNDRERQRCLRDPRSLLKLAANPYLLTQMVWLYNKPPHQLPKSKFELFNNFVDDLIFREIEARPQNFYPKAYQPDLLEDLKMLAWQLQSLTGSYEEVRTTLTRLEAEQVTSLLQLEFAAAASILELTKDSVRFSHQLMQEFFTAQGFSDRRREGLMASDLWTSERWMFTNGWEEAAKLAAQYESDPSDFLTWLAKGNPLLAVEIANDQLLMDNKEFLFGSLRDSWQSLIENYKNHLDQHERHAISTLLTRLDWDERKGISLGLDDLPDIEWIQVPAGEFIYGGGNGKVEQQVLHLNSFEISKFPVTNEQFKSFLSADDGYQNLEWWEGLSRMDTEVSFDNKENNRPAVTINWYEACAFCKWMSYKTDLKIRLPTEVEWEKAARGSDGRKYPWGNEDDHRAHCGEYPLDETFAVGLFPFGNSIYGISDMLDNVWEWCSDKIVCEESFEFGSSAECRVIRGSCFECSIGLEDDDADCTSRLSNDPSQRGYDVGFRIVSEHNHSAIEGETSSDS